MSHSKVRKSSFMHLVEYHSISIKYETGCSFMSYITNTFTIA